MLAAGLVSSEFLGEPSASSERCWLTAQSSLFALPVNVPPPVKTAVDDLVHRPEPAGEFFQRIDALDVPGRLVDQYQLPALAVPLGTRYPLAVRAPSLYVHNLRISTWVNGELQRSG